MIYDDLELLPEDLTGWNGHSNIFEKLINDINPKTIVEVGTWKGLSAINMAKVIKKNTLNCKIYCIDTWLGALEFISGDLKNTKERNLMYKNGYPQIYYQFLSNVVHNNVQDIIIPIPNTSLIGCKYLKNEGIIPELIYVDASHDEYDVYTDIKNYYELLKTGVIFGDDYYAWTGVKNAVDKFCLENKIYLEIYENNFWIIRK